MTAEYRRDIHRDGHRINAHKEKKSKHYAAQRQKLILYLANAHGGRVCCPCAKQKFTITHSISTGYSYPAS